MTPDDAQFDAPGPLHNVRVIELGGSFPSAYCARLLADQGARVVKVAPHAPAAGAAILEGLFRHLDRGKEIAVLDLKRRSGQRRLRRMIEEVDVVIEGFRPGVVQRLGVSYGDVQDPNGRLIYCSMSAFGQRGPLSEVRAHDINLQAISGLFEFPGAPRAAGRTAPIPLADYVAALFANASITAALYERGRSGRGCFLDVALADGIASLVSTWSKTALVPQRAVELLLDGRGGRRERWKRRLLAALAPLRAHLTRDILSRLPHYGLFATRDGRRVCLGIANEDALWRELCDELGGRFRHYRNLAVEQRALLAPIIRRHLARRLRAQTREYWVDRLAHRARLPVTPVYSVEEALADPQLVSRGLVYDLDGSPGIASPLARPLRAVERRAAVRT